MLFSCYCCTLYGQKGINSIGVGTKMGIPFSSKNFTYYYKDIGVSLQAGFGVTKLGTVKLGISYLFIGVNRDTVSKSRSRSLTLVQTGYRTHFLNSGFFVQAEGGLAIIGSNGLTKGSTANWIIGVSGGYTFKLNSSSFIDISPSLSIIGRNLIADRLWISGNIMYRFNLKKKNK